MTFAQYAAQLGVLLLQWLPICGLMYIAVRLGVQHGSRYSIETILTTYRTKAASPLTNEQRNNIGQP